MDPRATALQRVAALQPSAAVARARLPARAPVRVECWLRAPALGLEQAARALVRVAPEPVAPEPVELRARRFPLQARAVVVEAGARAGALRS
jgi:hypothetical protein